MRKRLALALALIVAVLTLGRVRVNWTGAPAGADGEDDPGRPAVTRSLGRERSGEAPLPPDSDSAPPRL